ncbi:MAG: TetR family transcriptional regulator [Osedax symbiont Rs2]|nr:MAG: TetR family transcriptional regulator [Osedax symbiont Rs2]
MKAGRHRSFDKDTALDQAMQVFWLNGYPGTSLADLTNAMGINKPSLYAAFGNKEKLYKSALERYVQKHGVIHAKHLFATDKNLNERVRCYLTSIAQMVTEPTLPGGCFVCLSTSEVGGTCIPTDALQTVFNINEQTKAALTDFFTAEIAAENLSSERSPVTLANYILSLQFGLSVMARNGAKLTELNEIIKLSTNKL